MAARLAVLTVLVALAAPASALAGAEPGRLANALRGDPVVVDAGAAKRLPAGQQGQVRLRILKRDIGRIKIVVTTKRVAGSVGGPAALADGVASALSLRGALLLVAGNEWRVVTSYPFGPTLRAVQSSAAKTEGRPLVKRLLPAVDALAGQDPGPGSDAKEPGAPVAVPAVNVPTVPAINIDTGGLKWAGIIGALTALIPIALVIFLLWRRRRAARADLEDEVAALREEWTGVAETLQEFDLDVEMPGVDPVGHDAYARALELHDQADQALDKATTPRRVQRAALLVREARAQADLAKERLATPQPPQLPGVPPAPR